MVELSEKEISTLLDLAGMALNEYGRSRETGAIIKGILDRYPELKKEYEYILSN